MKSRNLVLLALLLGCVAAQAGAWGYRSFENDDALDWIEESFKPDRQAAVEKAILRAAKDNGNLDAPEACEAIAACEILAAAQGRASRDMPKDVVVLAKKLPSKVSDSMRKNARDALDRILIKSELSDLWKEAKDNFENWKKTVEDLKARV